VYGSANFNMQAEFPRKQWFNFLLRTFLWYLLLWLFSWWRLRDFL